MDKFLINHNKLYIVESIYDQFSSDLLTFRSVYLISLSSSNIYVRRFQLYKQVIVGFLYSYLI